MAKTIPVDIFTGADITNMEREYRRTLINGLSGFKSLNLAGTISPGGRPNLAIMNSVLHIGADPPLMGLVFRPAVTERHTLENILATRCFTLNHVTEAIYAAAHQTSARYPEEVSEFEAVGLTPYWTEGMPAPYVAASPVRIGLIFRERHFITTNATVMIIGQIAEIHLQAGIVGPDGFPDLAAAGSITGSGLDAYYRTELIGRMAYAKPDLPPRPLT
ncbi:MAG: flavin reductase [Bacteroidia bacterium]|nr:flavin reductase [Bacteroidia bacterium]